MSKLFHATIFCFFLLFQTNSLAQEDTNATVQSPQNELTKAEQEAQAAEAAELREAGVEEEPPAE